MRGGVRKTNLHYLVELTSGEMGMNELKIRKIAH